MDLNVGPEADPQRLYSTWKTGGWELWFCTIFQTLVLRLENDVKTKFVTYFYACMQVMDGSFITCITLVE